MKKLSVVLYFAAALVILLGGASGTSSVLAASLPQKTTNTAVAAATGTSVLSIPATAFRPFYDGYDYENHGRYLIHYHSPGGGTANGWYMAPVYLPHGAVITKMTFYFKDTWIFSGMDGIAKLQRTQFNQGNFEDMASVDSSGAGSGYASKSTTTIKYVGVNNSLFAYWVVLDIPYTASAGSRFEACGVVIEYIPPATVTGILSIPAAAFTTPFYDGYDFENHGRFLKHLHGAGGTSQRGWYLAPVHLPAGATVTQVTFYYRLENVTTRTGIAKLQRTKLGQGNFEDMAILTSTGTGTQYTSVSTSSIQHNPIDNSQYAYWVVWDLPWITGSDDVWGCGVVIEYTAPTTGDGPLSISAASFMPFEDGYDYENHGRYVKYFHDPNGMLALGSFYAPVELPHGVVVTKVTYYYYDTYVGGNGGGINLQRTQFVGDYVNMAGIGVGNFGQGYSSYSDETIDYATIDNSHYSYWVVLGNLPVSQSGSDQQIWGCGVVIEYSYQLYLPIALKNY